MKNIDGKAYGQMILQMPDEDVKAQQAIHYLEDRKSPCRGGHRTWKHRNSLKCSREVRLIHSI